MKDRRNSKVVSSSPNICNLNGVRAILICKNSPEERILRRVREYLLYAKLRSLLPTSNQERDVVEDMSEEATEVELEPEELPQRDSDDESANAILPPLNETHQTNLPSKDEHRGDYVVCNRDKDEEGTSMPPFMPSIKIKRMDGSILISTIVDKNIALTSALFGLLEEEKLDIVFENQYRTETKVVHTFQVKLQPNYNLDALEKRLWAWAGCSRFDSKGSCISLVIPQNAKASLNQFVLKAEL